MATAWCNDDIKGFFQDIVQVGSKWDAMDY